MGVQLRALVGPSYLYAFQDVEEKDASTVSGLAVAFEFALGTMVSDELALNMDLVLARADGVEHGVLDDAVFTALHAGVGATYWLMPANIYLAASIGAARTSVEGEPVRLGVEIPNSDASNIGVGLHLALGKQWWVSPRWGLGASLSLLASTAENPIGGIDTNRQLLGAGVALSVTFH